MKRGILLLEGGAFRSVYTSGVLDALLEANIELDVAGVSGGALVGSNYISKQPDRSRAINVSHRHDPRYVGTKALKEEHGIIGFDYLFGDLASDWSPFDEETFFGSEQRFVAVTTCVETGLPAYFDKADLTREEFYLAIKASSSLPVVSPEVKIHGEHYLDGGASCAIPLDWAIQQGYEKIVVVRTRDRSYRKEPESHKSKMLYRTRYAAHPIFHENLCTMSERYNRLCDDLITLEEQGRIFTIAPEVPVEVTRLENDLVKLQKLYEEGAAETRKRMPELKAYLGIDD